MKATKKRFGRIIALLLVAALCLGCAGITGHYSAYAAEDADTAIEQVTDDAVVQTDEPVADEIADVSTEDTAVIDEVQDQAGETMPADSITEEGSDSASSFSVAEETPDTVDPAAENATGPDSAAETDAAEKAETALDSVDEAVDALLTQMSEIKGMLATSVLTAEGETYDIAVTYGPEAEIPEGAELQVKEIPEGTDRYDSYNEQAQKLVAQDSDSEEDSVADRARFFDIEIVSNGEKIEPSAPVEVKIEYADAVELAEGETLQVVHFADDGTEVITPEVSGNEITFTQDSFSVTGTIVASLASSTNVVLIAEHNGKYYEVLYDGSLKEVAYDGTSLDTGDTVQIDMAERWTRSGNNNRLRVQSSNGYTYISPTAASGLSTTQTNLTYNDHLLSATAGGNTSYLGVNVTATAITGGNSQDNAASFYLATVPNPTGNTVSHIDIGVVATAKVKVPLAYGPYYDASGNLVLTVSKDKPVDGYGSNNNIPITQQDLMSSTVSSYTGNHVPLNNFVITSFTTSTGSGQDIDQVRYNGTFPVGTSASSADKVYYNVDVTKPVDLTLSYDYDGDGDDDVLYDMDGEPLVVSVVTSLDASFDFWDSRNECPGILNSWQVYQWRDGQFITGNDGGMDFRLGASSESEAALSAIEIVKYVVDEDGNYIELQEDSDYVVDFEIYQNPNGDVTAPTAWSGETSASVDYSGYTTNDSRDVTVGASGIGLAYDYDVADGLTYIKEKEADIPQTITDADGNVHEYVKTYIETEYAWRNDNGEMHSNINQSDKLSAIPDVVGDYYATTWDEDGDGTPDQLHNTFLEFYVYNVYSANKTEVTVEKVWEDADDQDGIRPDSVEIVLTGSDGNTYKASLDGTAEDAPTGSDAAGYESDEWVATFINLPAKDADGEEITYSASETKTDVITGTDGAGTYAYDVSGTQADGFTITNTHTPEKVEKTITKAWDDADNQDGIRPTSVEVVLTGSDDNSYKVTLDGTADAAPTGSDAAGYESAAWKATFVNLPKCADGEEITYTYAETETDVITGTDGEGTYAYSWKDSTVTNKHTPETTEATVKKVWDDANNQDGKRPTTLKVTLSNGEQVTLNESNQWTAKVTGLPKYKDGKEIEYTWTEEKLPEGYALTDTSKDGTVTTLTNTYTPEKRNATIVKKWDDDNDRDQKRPQSLTVSLSNGNEVVEEVVLSERNEWTATVENLPVYDKGQEIKYTWTEDKTGLPEGYKLTDTSIEGTITTITNSYTPEKTEATVKKVWNDNDNQDGKRPANLTVTLSDGQTVTLNESNGWTATITGLPKYDGGEEIEYTWTEDEEGLPEGYKLTDTSVEGTVTTFTNSYQSDPVKKVFKGSEKTNIDGKEVQPGDELTYSITYTNTTGETAEAVTITDTIPEHTTYVDGSADNDGAYADGGITWTFEDVADGDSITVTFKVTVDDSANGAELKNKAVVNDGENEYSSNEVINPTTTPPPSDPVKDVFNAKDDKTSIDGKTVKAGDELIYKITYTNSTNAEVTAEITDTVPKNSTYVSGSADNGGVEKDGTITWSDLKMAAGESVTVSFKVKVSEDNGVSVDNTAKVKVGDNEYTTNKTVNPTEKVKETVVKKTIKKIKHVQTGDDTNVMLLSLVAIIAAIAALAIIRRRQKDA